MSGTFELPLDQRVVRLRAVRPATTTLRIEKTTWAGTELSLRLSGSAANFPDEDLACDVTCVVAGRRSEPIAATLARAPGGKRVVELKTTAARAGMFGTGRLGLVVAIRYARAAAVVEGTVQFTHPIEVTTDAKPSMAMGDVVHLGAKPADQLQGCQVRLRIREFDEMAAGRAQAAADEQDLDVTVDVPPEGATWQVGCDAAGRPEYAEPAEAASAEGYDFRYETQVSADGAAWVTIPGKTPLCRAKRPALSALGLALASERPAGAPGRSLTEVGRAKVRELKKGHVLGRSWLVVRGEFANLSRSLELPAHVRLWRHRPWSEGATLQRATRLAYEAYGLVRDGKLELTLLDGARLEDHDVDELRPPDGPYPPLEGLFAVLDLPGWTRRALPLDALLTTADGLRPFGDQDLPGPGKPAVAVCSEGVAGLELAVTPAIGPVGLRVEGDKLVASAALLGGDDAYWREARPVVQCAPVDQAEPAWQPFAASALVPPRVEASRPLARWDLLGKQLRFRVALEVPAARLRGVVVGDVPSPPVVHDCAPGILPPATRYAPEGGKKGLVVEAPTRCVPGGARLTVRLFAGAGQAAQDVAKQTTACGADGVLRALVELTDDALAKVETGAVQLEVTSGPVLDRPVTSPPRQAARPAD